MPTHQEILQPLQDEAAAQAFRKEYDVLLGSVIKPSEFVDFIHNAREVAPVSVLAAAVLDIAGRASQDEKEAPKQRRWLLEGAGMAADTVEALDKLYRKDDGGDLVLYTYPKINEHGRRGEFTAFHLTATAGAFVVADALAGRETSPDWYGIEPYVPHGADSTHIFQGNPKSWIQGSRNFFDYFGRDPKMGYQLGKEIRLPYSQISRGTPWGRDVHMPTITVGRDAVLELYEKWITTDAEEAYTEKRTRRPTYTLFRQAAFLADESYVSMVQLAEANGMADVWRQQIVDEEALVALEGIKQLHERGKRATDEDLGEFHELSRIELTTMDVEWLDIPFQDFVRQAVRHAHRLHRDIEPKEIEAALHETLGIDMRNRWHEEHRQRLLTLQASEPR